MSVVVRLARYGSKAKPYYRMVVADGRFPKEGRSIETIGSYDPMKNPALVKINTERLLYWKSKGAQLSDTVRNLANLPASVSKKTAATKTEKPVKATKVAAAKKPAAKRSTKK